MIDYVTSQYLELIANSKNPKSKSCLFGIMNYTSTGMGARLLRSSLLQPLLIKDAIEERQAAIIELIENSDLLGSLADGTSLSLML